MMKTHSKKSSRAIKRAFAVVMSFALAMSTLTVAPDAAAAKKVAPKLSVTKKTLYYNKAGKKTYTLKVKKNKVKKITKTTWKTSKKSVVAISKKTKTSVKLTAKKAGKAKITAVVKYTVKGSKKVKSKKLTFTATSKKAKVATPTPKPTATATATATAAPTATATATAEPTATATAEPSQTPIVGDVAKVEAIVTNSVMGHENTVLAGQDATIQVLVTDSKGNPVPNDNVVLTFKFDDAYPEPVEGKYYEIKSDRVAASNSKGIATFVVGAKAPKVQNDDQDYVGAYDFKVTDASENISATGKLKVAAISYETDKIYAKNYLKNPQAADVVCLNGDENYEDLVIGTNVNHKWPNGAVGGDGYARTTKNVAQGDVQYVRTQQVSTTGVDHKVAFKTGVYLAIPKESKDEVAATSHVQKIDKKSGEYGPYTKKTETVNYDITDLTNVDYATLTFNSLTLSRYTKLEVGTIGADGKPTATKLASYGDSKGAFSQKNFGLQISREELRANGAKGIYLELTSKGQVDADKNAGFDVKDLTYIYKKQETVNSKKVALDSASVKWETVTPVYTNESEEVLKANGDKVSVKTLLGAKVADYATVTAAIPVFPYVGNAIIRCYDSNKKVKKYYACEIENPVAEWDSHGNPISYKNVNILKVSAESDAYSSVYEISEAEATNSVGTLTEKNGVAEVDSKATGTTFLKGTITCSDENVKLDAKRDTVYTSIMWNPVAAKKVDAVKDAFMALVGQSVTVKAQLVDAEGNAVAVSGEEIQWSKSPDLETAGVTVIQQDKATNANGQATLKVSAGDPSAYMCGIAAANKDKKYNVVLKIGDKTVETADLYWISAALQFTDKVADGVVAPRVVRSDSANPVYSDDPAIPTVGETWMYATEVVPTKNFIDIGYGSLKGLTIKSITGVVPSLDKEAGSAGTVTLGTDGVAKVSSKENKAGAIIYTLDANTKFDKAQVYLEGSNGWPIQTVSLVGEGSPAIDETLTVWYEFEADGLALNFLNPMGIKSVDATKDVYVQVTDSQGNALKNRKVKIFSKENVFSNPDPVVTGGSYEFVTTNDDGIAKATINGVSVADTTKNVEVTATLLTKDSTALDMKADTSVNPQNLTYMFKNAKAFTVDAEGTNEYDEKVVTLTLTDKILGSSVKADQFTVKYVHDGDPVAECPIKSVVATDKTIKITLRSALPSFMGTDKLEVSIKAGVDLGDGISYAITSETTGAQFAADTLVLNAKGNVTSVGTVNALITTAKTEKTYATVKAAIAENEKLSTDLKVANINDAAHLNGLKTEVDNIDAVLAKVKDEYSKATDLITDYTSFNTKLAEGVTAAGKTADVTATVTVPEGKQPTDEATAGDDYVCTIKVITAGGSGMSLTKKIKLKA